MQHTHPSLYIPAPDYDRLVAIAEGAARSQPDAADFLLQELGRASTIAPSQKAQVVVMGSRVRYRDEATGETRTTQLVYPEHANAAQQKISVLTPVGAALIGLSQGQTMSWQTRDGRMKSLTVLEVQDEPESIS